MKTKPATLTNPPPPPAACECQTKHILKSPLGRKEVMNKEILQEQMPQWGEVLNAIVGRTGTK